MKARFQAGQPVTVVLPSIRNRRETYAATIVERDPFNDDEEKWICAVHLPATETQPNRSITIPGGFTLNQIEVSTQLSLF